MVSDMPARATLFNLKCEAVFDFGTGPRNNVYYNAHGNSILYLFIYLFVCLFVCLFILFFIYLF